MKFCVFVGKNSLKLEPCSLHSESVAKKAKKWRLCRRAVMLLFARSLFQSPACLTSALIFCAKSLVWGAETLFIVVEKNNYQKKNATWFSRVWSSRIFPQNPSLAFARLAHSPALSAWKDWEVPANSLSTSKFQDASWNGKVHPAPNWFLLTTRLTRLLCLFLQSKGQSYPLIERHPAVKGNSATVMWGLEPWILRCLHEGHECISHLDSEAWATKQVVQVFFRFKSFQLQQKSIAQKLTGAGFQMPEGLLRKKGPTTHNCKFNHVGRSC